MSPEEVYAALASGKKVEYNRPSWDLNKWATFDPLSLYECKRAAFRLAPAMVKYRRYFYKNAKGIGVAAYTPTTAFSPIESVERSEFFIDWLDDDWVEVECPV